MAFADVMKPGDKIDIRLVQQLENAKNTGEPVKVYKSQILDILGDGTLEISMPTEGTKLELLSLDLRYEFVFYSGGLLYRSIGEIVERYKKDNCYMNRIRLKTHPEKYQRREFYRYDCMIEFFFYELTEDEAQFDDAKEILAVLKEKNPKVGPYRGTIVDLSGGGIRFTTEHEIVPDSWLLTVFHLYSGGTDEKFEIAGCVVGGERIEGISEKKYEGRVKFLIKDDKIREEIIRYIFKEERLTRQKVRG